MTRNVEVHPTAPPIMSRILVCFPEVDVSRVIITYGGAIWVPSGNRISRELFAHECVHIEQQDAVGTDAWWDHYFVDPEFRYEQELVAHRAEVNAFVKRHGGGTKKCRAYREECARRLSGAMYGNVRTYSQVMNDLLHIETRVA